MESQEPQVKNSPLMPLMYTNRVALKTILESGDGETGLVGTTVVVGGWVKASREEKKEPLPPQQSPPPAASHGTKDVTCVEILQSRIPFFRTIIRVLGGSASSPAVRQKLESLIPKPPPPSIFFLDINDGSCVSSLRVTLKSNYSLFCFFEVIIYRLLDHENS